MIKNKIELKEIEVPEKIICDKCGKEFDVDKDVMEVQEFTCVRQIGGFASVFGDGAEIYYDICQNCLKKFLQEAE